MVTAHQYLQEFGALGGIVVPSPFNRSHVI